ncbi:MAG: tetrahydromethanopterin S-methyltransferase subunit C [Methanoregula sp.]|nr:tetrahydromethanopterin S-methyltransferase subunit C [Methanoregula sp.]
MTIKIDASQVDRGVPHTRIMIAGIFVSLVFLYLTYLNNISKTDSFSFFGGLAAVAAIVWGSDTIKILNSYGLATGVPSAGMIGFGAGVGAMLFSTLFGIYTPLVALAAAAATGLVIGYLANRVIGMNIPVMVRSLTELSAAGALTLLGLAALVTGGFSFDLLAIDSDGPFIRGGLIVVVFILGAIAIQHPWNAVLPTGKQDRMFMLAAECGFLSMMMSAILSFAVISTASALVSLALAGVCWLYTYSRYIALSRRDAAAWLDTQPIPDTGGDRP